MYKVLAYRGILEKQIAEALLGVYIQQICLTQTYICYSEE